MNQPASATLNFLNNPQNRHWCEQAGRILPHQRHYRLAPDWPESDAAAFAGLADRLRQDGARLLMLSGRPEQYRLNAQFTYYLIFDLFNFPTPVSESGILLILEYTTAATTLPPLLAVFLNHPFYGDAVNTFWQKLKIELPGRPGESPAAQPDPGRVTLNVGPDHAGIIPPGQFQFSLSGEEIDRLNIQLNFTRKQLAAQFARGTLVDGARLAAFIAGGHAVAHATAYCRAVESLANLSLPQQAALLRTLLLELERIHNHLHTLGGLVEHTGNAVAASDFFWQEEEIRKMCGQIFGDRLLRNQVVVGGVQAELTIPRLRHIRAVVAGVVQAAVQLGKQLYHAPPLRERLINCGSLTRQNAIKTGTTGLAWRASGQQTQSDRAAQKTVRTGPDYPADFRLRYPEAGYTTGLIQEILGKHFTAGRAPVFSQYNYRGDCFSRFLLRIEEIALSGKIIEDAVQNLTTLSNSADPPRLDPGEVGVRLRQAAPFSLGLAVVEGTVGPVCCLVLKDSGEHVEFFALADASLLNWQGLRAACTHPANQSGPGVGPVFSENLLGDFPLINKSFDLSYSARDL